MPAEVWRFLRGSIVYNRDVVDCRPIVEWLRVALTKNSEEEQPHYPEMTRPTSLLMDGDLIRQCHQIVTCHLPGIDPVVQYMMGSLIATHTGEVAVDLQQ